MEKIKVLIVDDSALVRNTLTEVLSSDPGIEVIGTAADPYIAAERLKNEIPDVITLDIEMPRMDGLTFLRKLMRQHPIPVIICSTLVDPGSDSTIKALEYGAVDVITKPKVGTRTFFEESRISICDVVKAAAQVKREKLHSVRDLPQPKLSADAVLPKSSRRLATVETDKILVIGASTGGTDALMDFLTALPPDAPPAVIVQHMPEKFTAAFANRLNSICAITVKEAESGDRLEEGLALIAPGNRHMLLKRSGSTYYVELKDGPLVSRHRPSVDVLFRSAAQAGGQNVIGIIMTGMGDDGAEGMLEMKRAGAFNIAQDEASCVVFGMPNEAIKRGGVDRVLSLKAIPGAALARAQK